MEEYKNKLMEMLSEKGFAKSPFTYDEIQSLFYNRISLEDACSMAYDVYTCEDGLMP